MDGNDVARGSVAGADCRKSSRQRPSPVQLLREEWGAVFTHPDITDNGAAALTGEAQKQFGDRTIGVATVHLRRVATDRFNGDDSPFEPCHDDAEANDVLGDLYDDPLFISPGAPRAVRLMVIWR